MITIEMHKVSLGYSHRTVLEDVNLRAKPGEIVGLIGPNGCGKSTMIRALSRIISPFSGRILIDGQDINRLSRHQMAHLIGVVPQMPLLPSAFTAFEIVLMGRNPHLGFLQYEGPKEIAITWQAMERTGTQSLAERRVSELSGGEIQGLLIARVLAQETKAILLDEPTANLDIGRQVEILGLIRNLCSDKNMTVLAALHDLNLAAQYCDRLVMLNEGRIYAEGTPWEVINERNIAEVYGAGNSVYSHPENSLPCVLLKADNGRLPGPVDIDKKDFDPG
jgi:iron complex transport system ATP-binding protein